MSQKVTKGHQIKKKLFWACGTCFIVNFARRIHKSKPFCNPTHKSQCQRRVRSPWVTKVQICELVFSNKKYKFLNQLNSGFQKCHFYCAMSSNAPNRSLEKWHNQRIRFLGYMFAKNRYINLKFGMFYAQPLFYNMYAFLEIWKKGFCSYIKVSVFFDFGGKNIFGEIRDGHSKELLILCILVPFICILL